VAESRRGDDLAQVLMEKAADAVPGLRALWVKRHTLPPRRRVRHRPVQRNDVGQQVQLVGLYFRPGTAGIVCAGPGY